MRAKTKLKRARPYRRDLFAELSEGMTALAQGRQGKRTLQAHRLGDVREELLDRAGPDRREHLVAVRVRRRRVAGHEPRCDWTSSR